MTDNVRIDPALYTQSVYAITKFARNTGRRLYLTPSLGLLFLLMYFGPMWSHDQNVLGTVSVNQDVGAAAQQPLQQSQPLISVPMNKSQSVALAAISVIAVLLVTATVANPDDAMPKKKHKKHHHHNGSAAAAVKWFHYWDQ